MNASVAAYSDGLNGDGGARAGRMRIQSITPITAAAVFTTSVIRYNQAIGWARTRAFRKLKSTSNSPTPKIHRKSNEPYMRLHCQRRAVTQASQALPRHQPPMVIVIKGVTFQAKTGARDSGKKNSNAPKTAYRTARRSVSQR